MVIKPSRRGEAGLIQWQLGFVKNDGGWGRAVAIARSAAPSNGRGWRIIVEAEAGDKSPFIAGILGAASIAKAQIGHAAVLLATSKFRGAAEDDLIAAPCVVGATSVGGEGATKFRGGKGADLVVVAQLFQGDL